jgi:hypothetical protein
MELSAPMLRCGKVDSTDPRCMMMPSHLFDAAANVRGMETSIQGMQCHRLRISKLISSMSGELISWGHFLTQKAMNTSQLPLTISLIRWKYFLVGLPMLCTKRGCSMKSSSRGTKSQEQSSVREDHTSLIRYSRMISQKLELITRLPLHITLRRAVKQKCRTSKLRISFRRQ